MKVSVDGWSLLWAAMLVFAFIPLVTPLCPNSCSGHGYCGIGNLCDCYDGWKGGAADCSLRTCPKGLAWANKPQSLQLAHSPVECSNAGTCDRGSGLCRCFPGYTGNACQRTTCPNECSGHGICSSIGDVSYFRGPDYNSQFSFAGDGYGPLYQSWDRDAINMCECDEGFFGSDCSLKMCPKGDDPLTINQEYRSIRVHVRTKNARYELGGSLGLRFQGETVFFPLEYMLTTYTFCNEMFAFKGKFGHVACLQATRTYQYFTFDLNFYSWPVYPRENNLYSHDGNPNRFEFSCDSTYATETTTCQFEDLNGKAVREYAFCSNRGYCNFKSGVCSCYEGFGGPACSNATYLYVSEDHLVPALSLESKHLNFNSSVLKIEVKQSANQKFNFLEAIARTKSVFYLRGDGLLAITTMKSLSGGQTISGGGLAVEKGGFQVLESGISMYNTDTQVPVLKAIAKNTGIFNGYSYAAVEVNTYVHEIRNHYYLVGTNREQIKIQLRADGAVLSRGGLYLTSGMSIYNTGLVVNDGVNITGSGLNIKSYGLEVGSGATIINEGLKVINGGVVVLATGVSINSVGLRIAGGLSVSTVGLSITNGLRVGSDGVSVREGLSVYSFGLRVTGGLTFQGTGMVVGTGGLTVAGSGMIVMDSGIDIKKGGLRIDNGGLVVENDGARITSAMYLDGDSHWGYADVTGVVNFKNGWDVISTGLIINGGMSVSVGGMQIGVAGMKVHAGTAVFLDGLEVQNNLISWGDPAPEFENTITYVVSDRKLKTDFTPIEDARAMIKSLSGVYYHWAEDRVMDQEVRGLRTDGKRHVGLIAQEVQSVLPEVVETDRNSSYLKVDYSSVVAVLIEGLNELTGELVTLVEQREQVSEVVALRQSQVQTIRSNLSQLQQEYEVEYARQEKLQGMAVNLRAAIDSLKVSVMGAHR